MLEHDHFANGLPLLLKIRIEARPHSATLLFRTVRVPRRLNAELEIISRTAIETALSDFYVEYELVAHGDVTVPRPVALSRLHEQILDVFNEYGVQIMSPNFEAQPEHPAIVDRSKWFAEPARETDRRVARG